MSDINFDCPKCGQNLDAPSDLAGLFIECPACTTIIKVPATPSAAAAAAAAAPRGNEFAPPPPVPSEDKGSTMRIDLPAEVQLPPPPPRKIIIKRSH
jgi:hypothetical protein